MKQKLISKLILVFLILNVTFFILWVVSQWISSLNIVLGIEEYFVIISVGMYTFIVVDTIEIILLRRGQMAWTKYPGKTLIKALKDFYDELQRDQKARDAFMVLAENFWRAGPFGGEIDEKTGKPKSTQYVKFEKSDFPENRGWMAKIANSHLLQDKLHAELSGKAKKVDPDLPSVDYGLVKK